MKSQIQAALGVAALVALAGCGGDNGNDGGNNNGRVTFNALPVIANLGDNVILPTYVALADASDELGVRVSALRANVTEGNLTAAQQAWKATRQPWESSEGFLFGPVDAQGIDPLIDTWPLSTSDLQAFLSAGRTSPADIRSASENVQGFHAIEYILFGSGVDTNDRPVRSIAGGEFDYLDSLVTVLREHTHDLETSWTTQYDPGRPSSGPYLTQFKSPQAGGIYVSQQAVVEELVNGIIGIIDEVGNGKMTEPLGGNIDQADTSLVESQYSWNSLTDFHNNIQSVLNIYTGVRGFNPQQNQASPGGSGLYAFVAAHDRALADQALAAIVEGYNAIALIDGDGDVNTTNIQSPNQIPFRQAIRNPAGRDRITAAIQKLQTAQDLLNSRVKPLVAQTEFIQ